MDGISTNDLFQASAFSRGYNGKRAKKVSLQLWFACNMCQCFVIISFKFGNDRLYVTDKGMHCLSWHFCWSSCFRSSLSLSLSVDIWFLVDGTLVGDFPRRCCAWLGFSNSNFFKTVGGSSWMCFAHFSQLLNFWIDVVGVSLNGIWVRFFEVCLTYCRCLFFYWLEFIF